MAKFIKTEAEMESFLKRKSDRLLKIINSNPSLCNSMRWKNRNWTISQAKRFVEEIESLITYYVGYNLEMILVTNIKSLEAALNKAYNSDACVDLEVDDSFVRVYCISTPTRRTYLAYTSPVASIF